MTVQVSSSPHTAATGHLAVTHLATALWESLETHEAATHLATALWASLEGDYCFYTALWKSVGIHEASFGLDKEIFKYIPLANSVEKCSICLVP